MIRRTVVLGALLTAIAAGGLKAAVNISGADEVIVVWPDGSEESFGSPAAGAVHELRRGRGSARPQG